MRIKTNKSFIYLCNSILVISLSLLFGCNKSGNEQLTESICMITSEGCNQIISRGTKLPTSFTDTFTNMETEQDSISITLYQGDDTKVESNRLIGTFQLPIKKAVNVNDAQIQVTFIVDQMKKLTIIVKDLENDQQKEILAGIVN